MLQNSHIIVLHGIFFGAWRMHRLSEELRRQGASVCNLDYPSTLLSIEDLVEFAWENTLKGKDFAGKSVHFVGYSMGALLIRGLLSKYRPDSLGRVVMQAPPNHGSEVADFLQNFWPYKKLFGPAGQDLTTDQQAISHLFGQVDYDLGILAGNYSIDAFSSLLIKGADDGKVSVESTRLEGMRAHKVLPVSHLPFPANRKIIAETIHYLKYGQFLPER